MLSDETCIFAYNTMHECPRTSALTGAQFALTERKHLLLFFYQSDKQDLPTIQRQRFHYLRQFPDFLGRRRLCPKRRLLGNWLLLLWWLHVLHWLRHMELTCGK